MEPMPVPMTAQEAAAFFRVSMPVMYEALRRGQVPAFRVGDQWRVWPPILYRAFDAPMIARNQHGEFPTWPEQPS